MIDETRTRFLAAIARQLPAERVIEVHLFGAIKQGGVESGVAVIALERIEPALPTIEAAADDVVLSDDAPDAETTAVAVVASRYIVYSARYRLTLKGPDRGKWETSVTEEADAPLITIDAVVRGVQRRSGDVDETVRLSGDEFRSVLPVPATQST
jgi:hypothetical protein